MPGVVLTNGNTSSKAAVSSSGLFTKVAVWNLNPEEHNDEKPPEETEALLSTVPGEESVIGKDERVLVHKEDFMPGGKYRAIVKLFLRFEGQEIDAPWAMATGWLVRSNLVVTAGHCSFDHSHELGRLTHVKAYIGYHGNESIDDPSYAVQFLTAKSVATTQSWLQDGSNEAADVSFILLDGSFQGVTPISYIPTPATGTSNIGVVGYPGDLSDPATGEKGAFMFEMFESTTWNVATSTSHMLQYRIDTYGGNSGSPVFIQPPTTGSDARSVGVHVYGGNINMASIIGPLGNVFETYLAALNAYNTGTLPSGATKEVPTRQPWLTYFNIPSQENSTPPWDPNDGSGNGGTGGDGGGGETDLGGGPNTLGGDVQGVDEGFLDILNKAVSVVKPIATDVLKVGLPIALGSTIGGPVAALAGVALNVAGKIAASSTGTEADIGKSYTYEGVAERAVLGEAAIAAIKHMGNDKCVEEGIFDMMNDHIQVMAPTVQAVAPKIVPLVAEPALRMSLNSLKNIQSGTEDSFASKPVRKIKKSETDTRGLGSRLEQNQEAFIKGLGEVMSAKDGESFLDVFSTIGDVVSKGLRVAGPIIGTVAKTGLSLLLPGTESEISPPARFTYQGLAERSLIGESALRTLMSLPPDKIKEEGLFDIMKKVVTTLGPVVIKTAPAVINAVTSVAHTLLQQPGAGEGSGGGGEVIITPDGDIRIDATDAALWSAENSFFSQNMHMLNSAEGEDIKGIVANIEKGTLDPQQFGSDTILFAISKYMDAAHHVLKKPGPARSYLKIFGGTSALSVESLSAQYPSLAPEPVQAELSIIQHTVTKLDGAELPVHADAVWFWFFMLSAIEKPGAVISNGSDVVLMAHGPVEGVSTNFAISPEAPQYLRISSADYIAIIRNMMVAFTTNTYPPHKDLSVW